MNRISIDVSSRNKKLTSFGIKNPIDLEVQKFKDDLKSYDELVEEGFFKNEWMANNCI